MDNKKKVGSPDKNRINVNEDYELDYWSNKFSVSHETLKEAVKTAGTAADAVDKNLKK